jgi:hypothetical protein
MLDEVQSLDREGSSWSFRDSSFYVISLICTYNMPVIQVGPSSRLNVQS